MARFDGRLPRGAFVAIGIAVGVLAAGSTVAIAAGTGHLGRARSASACPAPALPGAVVRVTLADMGQASMTGGQASMMGGRASMMGGGPFMSGMLRVVTDRAVVPPGAVSFAVTNRGGLIHELIVLPLDAGSAAGARRVGSDGRVDESTSAGEASRTCGAGEGDGIRPGASGWVTLNLAPGRYELLCNLPGHYAAGMFTELTVS